MAEATLSNSTAVTIYRPEITGKSGAAAAMGADNPQSRTKQFLFMQARIGKTGCGVAEK